MGAKRNKRLASLVWAGMVVLVAAGCIENAMGQSHHNYFPLNVGNSWTYTNGAEEKTFTTIGTKEINGHTYYEFDDYVRGCGFPGFEPNSPADDNDVLFRYEPYSDRVLQYWPSRKEDVVRYDFSQDMWGQYGNQLIEMGISRTVPAGDFNDCGRFAYGMTGDCGVFTETLAPGVGNIKFSPDFELASYAVVTSPNSIDGYVFGDINRDCRVDMADFAVLAGHWLEDPEPCCAVRTTYVFQPDPNALEVSGGLGGWFYYYGIEGQFDLIVDSCTATAWFSRVDAQLSGVVGFLDTESPYHWISTDSLEALFDMTELVSTDVSETTIGFLLERGDLGSCWDGYCMTDIHLRVTFIGDSVHLVGDFCDPCCDFYCYRLDAVAVRQP